MFTVIVTLEAAPDMLDEFLMGLRENAMATRAEPGCLRFDVHRVKDHPAKFVLYELYESEDAFFRGHREAPHYPEWRELAARCVVPGTHVNVYAYPAFTDDAPAERRLGTSA